MAGFAIAAIGIAIASTAVSIWQYNENVDRADAQLKKASDRADAAKLRDKETAKRQLRQAAMEVGKRQLELSMAKRKKVSAMHEAKDSKANYAAVEVKPGARSMGRPVIG